MTTPAAKAALAGALHQELGDYAEQAASRVLRQLHRDGWQITANPSAVAPGPKTERSRRLMK